uniref:NADH-ubiquinone oxidoreductase chain 4 n=1 Tax=Himacerus apterus TaxID=347976 RepID=K7NBB0_9HEMI|nr:NADH dehydrogenase subunit 4 [Himacerus apterus]
MMSMLISLMFMIPLSILGEWWLLCFNLIVIMFYYMNSVWMLDYYSMVSYTMGGDMLSLSLVMLSLWIVMLMYMSSINIFNNQINDNVFNIICMILLMCLILTFTCMNMFNFYLYFEFSLIPTLFLIFGWGYQPERLVAGYYLLFYTLFASLPLLVCLFYLFNNCYTLFYFLIMFECNFYIYMSLIVAFLIKMPLIMFHFWLLKAHVEAPVSGSMILAGILLKLGGYGMMRVYMFMYEFSVYYNYMFICLSLYGMCIVGMLCLIQTDIKVLIAYSSVAHMGLVICGIMTFNMWGLLGSLLLMIGHGLCSSSLFCLANIIYERMHSRSIIINKGLLTIFPSLSLMWFISSINNMASPPSLNLLGEILLLNSILSWDIMSWLFLGFSSFMSCCYSIYMYSYINHGNLYSGIMSSSLINFREFMLIIFHLLPLNMIFIKVDFLLLWL